MKRYLALALAVVMTAVLFVPVMAADSPHRPIEGIVEKVTDKDGNDVTEELRLEINDVSRAAEDELTNDKIKDILGDDYNEDLVLADVYDVIYTGSNYPIELTVKQNVSSDDVAYVLTKVNGEWIAVEGIAITEGRIVFSMDEDSVIAFVYERTPGGEGPVTGNNVVFIAMIALVCLAGTVYCVKRTVA